MDTVENGQSIGEGELRSRVPRHESMKQNGKADRETIGGPQANKLDKEENKAHERVKKTFGRTPDGTGM